MVKNSLHKFFLSIVFPTILAIALFVISIYAIILPAFENAVMEKKKEMIRELTNTAWSLLEEYDKEYTNNNISIEDARKMAALRISKMRYGNELKDYFWITDKQPVMIMHPYREDLIHSDLNNYVDPNGKKLFVEAVNLVNKSGEGFINYMWQLKDDTSKIVPKLSYVKGYKPWGWIIGTGIYLEDVKSELVILKNRLLRISLLITLIISSILLFIIRQSLIIENKRKKAEAELKLSRQKYKSLVEASTEGTLMILNEKIIFSNLKFSNLSGYDTSYIPSLSFDDIFKIKWTQVVSTFEDPKKTISLETRLMCQDGTEMEVVISISKIRYTDTDGYIIVTKEISTQKQLEVETEHLTQELQTSLLLMNQPLKYFVRGILKCHERTSIHEAAVLMIRKKKDILFIEHENEIIGVVNDSDFKKRALAEKLDLQKPVLEIMTAPVISISENAYLYEAVLLIKNKNISHLGIKNSDNIIVGAISKEDIDGMQHNSVSYLIKEIEVSENIEELIRIYSRLPVLVNALVESGDKTANITRIITSVSDSIGKKVIQFVLEEMGNPPCGFAFMVMGSEGRMEQTLSTDQDNAIIFEDCEADKIDKAYFYFQELGRKVCKNLNKAGYKLCKGEVMASNPKWTQPWSIWKEYFNGWINNGDPQSIMEASIFFDFRCVFGDEILVKNLRSHVNKALENKSVFFYHLAQSVSKFKPPIGIFGNIIGTNSSDDQIKMDVKKIMHPIVGFIRLYSLHNKIDDTNSLIRVKQLLANKVLTKEMYDELVLSYNYLMQMRFRFQSISMMNGGVPDNIVEIDKLTHIEIATTKKIIAELNNLQIKVNFDFKGSL